MTEQEWLQCADPQPMLEFLQGKISDRKLRLFACHCCRALILWDYYGQTDVYEPQIQVAERFAEGEATEDERGKAYAGLIHEDFVRLGHPQRTSDERTVSTCLLPSANEAAGVFAHIAAENGWHLMPHSPNFLDEWDKQRVTRIAVERGGFATLLRHIVGNPFRASPLSACWPMTVVQLFHSFQEGQDCTFALHDALLDAGHPDLAQHFQDEKDHPKGCWAMDLLSGKE